MGIAHDNNITNPKDLKQIENAVLHNGEAPELHVTFFVHATTDHKAEAQLRDRIEQGSGETVRPIFKESVYIQKRHQGQVDFMSKPANDQDKRDFPDEWQAFEEQRKKPEKHGIQLLPKNTACIQAVFNHLNIYFIEDFLDFVEQQPNILDVFDELVPLHEAAKRWRTFMKPRLKLVNGEIKDGSH